MNRSLRRHRPRRCERGYIHVEYLGVLIFVGFVLAAGLIAFAPQVTDYHRSTVKVLLSISP